MLKLVKDDLSVQPGSPPRQQDYNRRRFLSWLRDEVAILRALGMDHRRIAAVLDIEEHDVRAFSPKPREKTPRRNLPRRAVEALLHGRHASIGGRTVAKRSRHLIEIASAYTWDELMAESGVGSVTANQIRLWLEERGRTLRCGTTNPQSYPTE
ncbi:hypothetical protein [Nitrobacter sp. TKz-YC01]|uniref:hypothetical protein n=1 Tax=Nitrobacter sp. TKz-YC01 TaxID=3398703 RepID=UPI003A0FED83